MRERKGNEKERWKKSDRMRIVSDVCCVVPYMVAYDYKHGSGREGRDEVDSTGVSIHCARSFLVCTGSPG